MVAASMVFHPGVSRTIPLLDFISAGQFPASFHRRKKTKDSLAEIKAQGKRSLIPWRACASKKNSSGAFIFAEQLWQFPGRLDLLFADYSRSKRFTTRFFAQHLQKPLCFL